MLKFWLNGPRPAPKRMYLLDGCSDMISKLELKVGDTILIYGSQNGLLSVEVDRKIKFETSLLNEKDPSSA